MGCLPNVFPGYQYITVPENLQKFEKAWGAKLSGTPGLTMYDQIEAALAGKIKGLVVFGANPVVSYPDINRVERALKSLELLVAMDIFPTTTTDLAHVVLPAASFAETEGTFSSSERRVQRVRQAIKPIPGKENWQTIQELSNRLGYAMQFNSSEEIFAEMASLTPAFGGMSFARLFHAVPYRPPAEGPDADYPFWLTTGTIFTQYLTGTMTRRCASLHHENPEVFVEINPVDARRLHIEEGEEVAAGSRRGTIKAKALLTERVKPGVVFIPLHYVENAANRLTNPALDPVTKTPEYKVCAVRLDKVGNQ
jgi:predicted molibdopterin-dependent oxidoreductase YjgC